MSTEKGEAIKAALSIADEIADGRLDPAEIEAATTAECRKLVAQVIGPGDPLWELQLEVARGVLAVAGLPAFELAEWLAVQRATEGDAEVSGDE